MGALNSAWSKESNGTFFLKIRHTVQKWYASNFNCAWGAERKLGETNEGTIPKQCAKFQNFLPYGSMGCHILQWQKKEENDKEDK